MALLAPVGQGRFGRARAGLGYGMLVSGGSIFACKGTWLWRAGTVGGAYCFFRFRAICHPAGLRRALPAPA